MHTPGGGTVWAESPDFKVGTYPADIKEKVLENMPNISSKPVKQTWTFDTDPIALCLYFTDLPSPAKGQDYILLRFNADGTFGEVTPMLWIPYIKGYVANFSSSNTTNPSLYVLVLRGDEPTPSKPDDTETPKPGETPNPDDTESRIPGEVEANVTVKYWSDAPQSMPEAVISNDKKGDVRSGKEILEVVNIYMLEAPANWDNKPITVTWRNLPSLNEGEGFILYHYNEDGTFKEEIPVTWNSNVSAFQSVITSFSPFKLVKVKDYIKPATDPINFGGESDIPEVRGTGSPVSPQTGEVLPAAGMIAVLCLAGALVCARKARRNG